MARELARRLLSSGHLARVVMTEATDGDLAVGGPDDATLRRMGVRRATLAGGRWTFLHQVHGADVVEVTRPGEWSGSEADAAMTTRPDCVLAVRVADCVPIALIADGGGVAAVHAGWRGLRAGVVETAAQHLRRRVPGTMGAVIGTCIGPCCYEFGEADLGWFTARHGDEVGATTKDGRPALDLRAVATDILVAAGIDIFDTDPTCTSCDGRHWSHRADGTSCRQALITWMEPDDPPPGGRPGRS